MKKKNIRRAVKLTFQNGESSYIDIARAVEIDLSNEKEFVYLDKKVNGTWILSYTRGIVPESTLVKNIEIIREDPNQPLTSANLRNMVDYENC